MAKATEKFVMVERVVIEGVRDGVTLELTQDEARALVHLLGVGWGGSIFYDIYLPLRDLVPYEHGVSIVGAGNGDRIPVYTVEGL